MSRLLLMLVLVVLAKLARRFDEWAGSSPKASVLMFDVARATTVGMNLLVFLYAVYLVLKITQL